MGLLSFLKSIAEVIAAGWSQPSAQRPAAEAPIRAVEEPVFSHPQVSSPPSSQNAGADPKTLVSTGSEQDSASYPAAPLPKPPIEMQVSVSLERFKLKAEAMPAASRAEKPPKAPAEPAVPGDGCWIPAGQAVQIAGKAIPGGMLYVGKGLKPVMIRNYSSGTPEPALLNPALPVNFGKADYTMPGMSYWPAYAAIGPEARASYLAWLAQGRSDPQAYIGYVFLFFYGLERRILHDAQDSLKARAEVPVLLQEVERLLDVYGSNHSFAGYASRLLQAARVLYDLPLPDDSLEERYPDWSSRSGARCRGWDSVRPWEICRWLRTFSGPGAQEKTQSPAC